MSKIKILFVSILLASTLIAKAQVAKKPNVIIIFNDDMGYQDLGCYGSPNINTPRIDQLAKEGMMFTDFYVASSVCSASRASLLTGCYPQRVGIAGVLSPGTKVGLNPKHSTIAEVLKSTGYTTAAIGKWHLGESVKFLPTSQGFDSYYGIPYSNDMFPSKGMKYAANCLFREGFDSKKIEEIFTAMGTDEKQPMAAKNKVPLMQNDQCIEFPTDQTTITKRYADESIKFIKKSVQENKPFFLYLANNMPHTPLHASPEFVGKSKRGLYGDVVEELDFNTGRILDLLKELNIDKNTIVIFSSDNGPWLAKGKDSGSALPLFEGKFTSFEGGMRVPCIVRWPLKITAGSTCKKMASSLDILPTLAASAGAKLPDAIIDGKEVLELWKGKPGVKPSHENLFMVLNGEAVRSGDWKYHKKQSYTVSKNVRTELGPALYNLKEDIGETTNLIDKEPEVAARLAAALEEHLKIIKN